MDCYLAATAAPVSVLPKELLFAVYQLLEYMILLDASASYSCHCEAVTNRTLSSRWEYYINTKLFMVFVAWFVPNQPQKVAGPRKRVFVPDPLEVPRRANKWPTLGSNPGTDTFWGTEKKHWVIREIFENSVALVSNDWSRIAQHCQELDQEIKSIEQKRVRLNLRYMCFERLGAIDDWQNSEDESEDGEHKETESGDYFNQETD